MPLFLYLPPAQSPGVSNGGFSRRDGNSFTFDLHTYTGAPVPVHGSGGQPRPSLDFVGVDDLQEVGLQAGAPDQEPVDVRLGRQLVAVLVRNSYRGLPISVKG